MSLPTHQEQVDYHREQGDLLDYYMFKRLAELEQDHDEIRKALKENGAWVGLSKWFDDSWTYEEFREKLEFEFL